MKLLGIGKGSPFLNLALGLFLSLASLTSGALAAEDSKTYSATYKGNRVHVLVYADGKLLTDEASNPIKGVSVQTVINKVLALIATKGDPQLYKDLSFDEDGQII